jgi:RecA-family ATPase
MINALDLAELRKTDPPPIPWIVPGVLASKAVSLIYGDPGVGKSLTALALAQAITEGGEAMGLQCKKDKVLLLDAENGKDEIHRRVRALGFESGLYPCEVTGFSIDVNFVQLEDHLWHAEFPGVLLLDSLRSLWPEGDENDSASVTRLLQAVQALARNLNLAVLIIHHPNKSGGFRGSGALSAVPEIVIKVGRNFRDKDETRRYLKWEKCRLGPARSQKWFAIQASTFGQVQIVPSHAPIYSPDPDKSELWPEH